MSQQPSIGRVVHYRLTQYDVDSIERRKTAAGAVANPHTVGQVVPLDIVLVWPDEHGAGVPGVNGQAKIDGNFQLWITSAREGTEPGTWSWPPRV